MGDLLSPFLHVFLFVSFICLFVCGTEDVGGWKVLCGFPEAAKSHSKGSALSLFVFVYLLCFCLSVCLFVCLLTRRRQQAGFRRMP